jgi:hypothetical protein
VAEQSGEERRDTRPECLDCYEYHHSNYRYRDAIFDEVLPAIARPQQDGSSAARLARHFPRETRESSTYLQHDL